MGTALAVLNLRNPPLRQGHKKSPKLSFKLYGFDFYILVFIYLELIFAYGHVTGF